MHSWPHGGLNQLFPLDLLVSYLGGILERGLEVLEAGVGGRTVAEEHVVGCVDLDRVREVAHSLLEPSGGERRVTLRLF